MASFNVTDFTPLSDASLTDGLQYESLDSINARYASALLPVTVFFGLIGLVGTVGNVIVIVVFSLSPDYRNNTFRVFVICLALIDLITCLTLIPAEISKNRTHFSFPDATPCKLKCFFNLFGTNSAAFTLLVISIDRFRKVCQPLKKQIWSGLAIKILMAVMILSFLLSLPSPIMCGISTANKTNIYNSSTTVYLCTAEEKYQHSFWRKLYKIFLTLCLLVISLCFIVLYSMIGRTVWKHWGSRAVGSSVRFDSSRSEETSDKIEADRLTDDVFSPEEMRDLAAKYGLRAQDGGVTKDTSKDPAQLPSTNAAVQTSRKVSGPRKNSSFSSPSSSIVKKKPSLRKVSSRGSDASFKGHALRRRSSSATAGKVPYKTLIWLILTVVFIVTYFLYAILSFLVPTVHTLGPGTFAVYSLFYRLYFINNAINPIIYALLDKRFKSSSKHIFRRFVGKVTRCCK